MYHSTNRECLVYLSIILYCTSIYVTAEVCNVTTYNETNLSKQEAFCADGFEFPLEVEETNITNVIIHSGRVKNITKSNFEKYKNLEKIDVSNCVIDHIDPDAFELLENLTELSMAANQEFKLPTTGRFLNSKSLKILNLSYTGIDQLIDETFEGLPNLEVLDLTAVPLQHFSMKKLFEKLSKLNKLFLSKDDHFNANVLCNETHLSTIIFRIEDGNEEVINCSKLNETKIIVEETINTTTNASKTEEEINTTTKIPTTVTITPSSPPSITPTEKLNTSTKQELETKTTEIKSNNESSSTITITTTGAAVTTTTTTTTKHPTTIPLQTHNTTAMKSTDGNETKTTEPKPELPPPESNKGNLYSAVNAIAFNKNESNEQKISNRIQEQNENISESESTSPSPASTGTNIVLGIILCVMVVGAVAFGYKYWQKRRQGYRSANTEETNFEDGKELQNIIAHRTEDQE